MDISWAQVAAVVVPTIIGSVVGTVGSLLGFFWKYLKKKSRIGFLR